MEYKEIFAKRLKNARIMKGWSMDDLCNATNGIVSKMSISKYENSKAIPGSSILIAFANALNLPVDYFVRPFTIKIDSIKFRKRKSSLGIKKEKSIKENIADLIERYIEIEEICDDSVNFTSPFDFEIKSKEQVKECAEQLREIWQLGVDGIVNIISILEEHGIKVMEIEAPDTFDGLSSFVNDVYPIIILNKSFCSERKRFTALHELGHIILHFDSSVDENCEEKLCNYFANEMLLPESVFKRMIGEHRHDICYEELRTIQLQFGISCDAMMYKAKESGIISEQRYKYYCISKNKNPDFKKMVECSLYPNKETFRFRRLVFRALCSELITYSKAAALLNESIEEVRGDLALV